MESIIRKLKKSLPGDLLPVTQSGTIVFIEEAGPQRFWSELIGSLEAGSSVVLMDPDWPPDWRETLVARAMTLPAGTDPSILIPTSGSTGLPKFCVHNLNTLEAAAKGYRDVNVGRPVQHSVTLLPQCHIGGLMPVFRSALCGGRVHFGNYRDAESMLRAPFNLSEAAISLVPTQLRRMREISGMVAVLRSFGLILIGGAACPVDLLEWAKGEDLRLAPCYGSTETAAMVTMLSPDDFLAGKEGVGSSLPHADIQIRDDGRISITASSLFNGYHPADRMPRDSSYMTGDIGTLDADGNLHILGRADRVIITGGKNVHPELVENAAMATGLLASADCRPVNDPDWGQRIELWIDPVDPAPGVRHELETRLRASLPPYARPKHIHLIRET